jgi:hypothetical protein
MVMDIDVNIMHNYHVEILQDVQNVLEYTSIISKTTNHWGSVYTLNIPKRYFKLMYEYFPYSLTRKKFEF